VIANRLAEAIESAGSSHLRHPIDKILVDRGRAVGVRIAPREGKPARDVRAGIVISNADLKRTLLELVGAEHLPSEWLRRSEGFEMAAPLFMTFLGIRGDLRDQGMSNTNYWQFDDFDIERYYRDAEALRIRGAYITSATLKDPENARHHAPPGISNLEIMTVVSGSAARWGLGEGDADAWKYSDVPSYRDAKRRIEDDLLARVEALFPGTAEKIVFRESATPITHRRFTGATGGTGYGLAGTPAQFMRHRPDYRGPVAGLYFCGASMRAAHGIGGALRGGRRAAIFAAEDLRHGIDRS
jgi:phytoene dehydrogenase-like protein